MADEAKWRCPICHRTQEESAYMLPCLDEFCCGCAMHCALRDHKCPLCNSWTASVLLSVRSDEDCIVLDLPGLAKAPAEDQQEEQGALGPGPRSQVGSFPAKVWADFFKKHPNDIKPLLPWLRWQLEVLLEEQWWRVTAWQSSLFGYLCSYGLDEEVLVQELQNNLQEHTRPFIRRLITAAERLCGREIRRYLGQQDTCAADGEDNNPVGSPTTGTDSSAARARPSISWTLRTDSSLATAIRSAGSDGMEEAGLSEAALHRGLTFPFSLPIPVKCGQLHEEPEEVAAAGPFAPGQGMDHSTMGPRHLPKRRASSPLDPPKPCKRLRLAESPSRSSGVTAESQVAVATCPPAGWGRDGTPGGPCRPSKRRASSPLDPPQPCKRLRFADSPSRSSGVTAESQVAVATCPPAGWGRDGTPGGLCRPPKRGASSTLDPLQPCKRLRLADSPSASCGVTAGFQVAVATRPPAGWGTDGTPGGLCRPPKRRASSPLDPPQPCKRLRLSDSPSTSWGNCWVPGGSGDSSTSWIGHGWHSWGTLSPPKEEAF